MTVKIKTLKAERFIAQYRCTDYECRALLMKQALYDPPVDTMPWKEFEDNPPRCKLCKSETKLEWTMYDSTNGYERDDR